MPFGRCLPTCWLAPSELPTQRLFARRLPSEIGGLLRGTIFPNAPTNFLPSPTKLRYSLPNPRLQSIGHLLPPKPNRFLDEFFQLLPIKYLEVLRGLAVLHGVVVPLRMPIQRLDRFMHWARS